MQSRASSLLAEIHGGKKPIRKVETMSAPAIRGVASSIRDSISALTKLASDAKTRLDAEVAGFKNDIGDVSAMTDEISTARAEVRAALGTGTNGGPALDDLSAPLPPTLAPPGASPTSSAQLSNSSAQAPNPERTPIGMVKR